MASVERPIWMLSVGGVCAIAGERAKSIDNGTAAANALNPAIS
ncbi:hypothetical protein ACVOMV_14820 [Mesorhizobium atlanticum]